MSEKQHKIDTLKGQLIFYTNLKQHDKHTKNTYKQTYKADKKQIRKLKRLIRRLEKSGN